MASKKRISFKWKVFFPLAILLWVTIATLTILHFCDYIHGETEMIFIIISLAVAVTAIAYYSSRYLSRNIRALRDFAKRAASSDDNTIEDARFPHTELGDISRQIVDIYNQRRKEQRRREKEHRIAMHAIEEKSLLKRQLTNNINHELKTPVGIIKGYIDTIIDTPDMDNDTRLHFLRKTQEHVDRLCTLLNDISTLTRLDEAGGNLPTEAVNFHDLVFTVVGDIEESRTLNNMEFVFDIPFDCEVKGNYTLLSSVISNFTKNAITYSHGTEMGIKLINTSERFYTFCFYDNGVGVDEKHIPFLFDRFFRIDSGRSRKSGGTGLGLPIAKNTIVNHGGTISVKNRLGGGLEFMFTLPKFTTQSSVAKNNNPASATQQLTNSI